MSKRTYPSGSQKQLRLAERKQQACENVHRVDSYFGVPAATFQASAVDSTTSSVEPEMDELMLHAVGLSSLSEHSQPAPADTQPDQSFDNSARNVVDTTS